MLRERDQLRYIRACYAAFPARYRIGRNVIFRKIIGKKFLTFVFLRAFFAKRFSERRGIERARVRFFAFGQIEQFFKRNAKRRRDFAELRDVRLDDPAFPARYRLRMYKQFIRKIILRDIRLFS